MTWENEAIESMMALCKYQRGNKMKNKCHYNGEEFVPCEDFGSDEYRDEREYFAFCPFCGESLIKPEPEKPELPWWLVPGMLVVSRVNNHYIRIVSHTNLKEIQAEASVFKPIGGPFDMVPEWATHIEFDDEGYFRLFIEKQDKTSPQRSELGFIWHNCLEEFKGKTFSLEGLK